MTARIARYHEDDEGEIQILPAENWENCARQLEAIEKFSDQHRDPGGAGWTDIYIREEERFSLIDLRLSAAEVSRCFETDLPAFDSVEIDSSGWKQCQRTQAFGFDSDCVIYLTTNQAGTVEDIWLGLNGPVGTAQASLLVALQKLSKLGPLLLVDWAWGSLFALADQEGIAGYLRDREQRFQEIDEEFRQTQQQREISKKKPWWKFWT